MVIAGKLAGVVEKGADAAGVVMMVVSPVWKACRLEGMRIFRPHMAAYRRPCLGADPRVCHAGGAKSSSKRETGA
jgi:hypothetical protein